MRTTRAACANHAANTFPVLNKHHSGYAVGIMSSAGTRMTRMRPYLSESHPPKGMRHKYRTMLTVWTDNAAPRDSCALAARYLHVQWQEDNHEVEAQRIHEVKQHYLQDARSHSPQGASPGATPVVVKIVLL
ncbi:hypothetical protein Vafri_14537, partial [Volvox africanus]